MSKLDDGGPAFPSVSVSSSRGFNPDSPSDQFVEINSENIDGMTLRDYYIGQAMIGIASVVYGSSSKTLLGLIDSDFGGDPARMIATAAIKTADAVMNARAK